MATVTSTETEAEYKYVPRMDRVGLDLMLYGVAFEIDGQRIDPARVRVHTTAKSAHHSHTPVNSSPHIAIGE